MNSPVTSVGQNSTQQLIFPPERGIGVLAVYPPYPPGFKPQSDSALGININMVHGDRDGLLAYILVYLNMAVGDYIKVYIDTTNATVAEFSVTDAHFDDKGQAKNIPFHISVDDMESRFLPLQPENKDFWFEVKRVSGNSEESPPVPLFYKYPAPGEPDTDGGKPFNQGLKLPIASESVVDQTVIDEGMFVTVLAYFNQSIGDVVVLAFGSLLLEITVIALGDVVFELTPAMLATLAPTNSLVVRWEVFDVVENSSGWSDALTIKFTPGIVLLVAPIFEQADPDNVVHHDWLAGGPMKILVTGVFAINDRIELTLEGLTKDGDPATHTFSVTLAAASRTVDFLVENDWVRNLIRGSLRATYKLIRAGKPQQSKPADVTITGTSQPLGLPVVEPLENNDTVPVDTVMATVKFAEYWPLKPGAKAELRWQTTDPDGIRALFIFQKIVIDTTLPIIFQVLAKYIAPYPSGPLEVQCSITNSGEVEVVSDVLSLNIGDEKDIVLVPPNLVGAVGPIDPLGAERTMQAEFLAAITGDRARLVHTEAPPNSPTFVITPFDQNKRATWGLDRKFLIANHGKTVRLHWNLWRKEERIASSPPTSVTIAPIVPQDSRFPRPYISGVPGVLEVQKLTAANRLIVAPWPGQAPRQAKYLRFQGTNKSGATVSHQALDGELTGPEQGSTTALFLAWLSELKDETYLYIYFSVSLGPGQAPLPFPTQTYRVESLVELQPAITAVHAPQGEVPQNTETISPTLTIHCRGSVNEQIELVVNGAVHRIVTTDGAGNASGAVTVGNYDAYNSIVARAKYGNNLSSPPRNVILRRPLQMDTRQMSLHGYRVYTGWPTTGRDFPGNTDTRTAYYGVGTRRFSSSNPAVASVDANGKVTGLRNGGAWIYVQDQFTTLTFYVSVANVYTLATLNYGLDVAASVNWMNGIPGSQSVALAFSAMQQVYGTESNWPLRSGDAWGMCYPAGCPAGYNYVFAWRNGGLICGRDHGIYLYHPWCLRPY